MYHPGGSDFQTQGAGDSGVRRQRRQSRRMFPPMCRLSGGRGRSNSIRSMRWKSRWSCAIQFGVELKNASTAAKAMQSFDSLADFVIEAPKVKK